MSLTVTVKDHMDRGDASYVTARDYTFTSGKKVVGRLGIGFGDANSANTTRGTIEGASLKGKFFTPKHWHKTGYTWRGDYVAVQYSEQELLDIAHKQWAKLLDELGLQPV